MVSFNLQKAEQEVLKYCSYIAPRAPVNIARFLKTSVPGFYEKSNPSKIVSRMENSVLNRLVERGLLVKYTSADTKLWQEIKEMVIKTATIQNLPVPRGVTRYYHTHFMYSISSEYPELASLPPIRKDMNFNLVGLMKRFPKTPSYSWDMLNLLLSSADKKQRDDMRIHLYTLPFDYNEIEFLENVLEYGNDFIGYKFPFKPDVEEAKEFLTKLSKME